MRSGRAAAFLRLGSTGIGIMVMLRHVLLVLAVQSQHAEKINFRTDGTLGLCIALCSVPFLM
ncbi:hypothetical protein FD514_08140 [Cutibacterium acnes]|nr:hypothetical protein HMPREF9344_01628 [Cutibacterium acnes HL097PA1]EIA12672.1 hypothetical protein TICEST70_00315 [Cutibacterium acnes PRP-38]REB11719.1 hypothetical protein COH13_08165 [Cutibacterium acnes]REB15435.1 hypothetical protein COH12_10885 [Cutibacterium acnes]TLG13647.1 hypothetical protein FD522_06025 [Cutibacterium acnes]